MMSIGRTATTAILLALCVFASTASADDEFSDSGLYLRGGVAFGFDSSLLFSVDSSVGVGGAAGYRFHPHFAAEVQAEWQGTMDILDVLEISRTDVTANLKAFAMTGRFQPYAVLGIGYGTYELSCTACTGGTTSTSTGGFLGRIGGGFDVYVTKNLGLYFEGAYMATAFELASANLAYGTLGVGAIVRF